MNAIFDNAVALIGELDIVNRIEGNMYNLALFENKGINFVRLIILITKKNVWYSFQDVLTVYFDTLGVPRW